MKILSRITAAFLTAGLALSLAGCNSENSETTTISDSPNTDTISNEVAVVSNEMRDISASDLFEEMTVGWNLGNSLDAVGNGTSSEMGWGNPKTTKELIDAVKDAGFNTVRIPITWMGHLAAAPEYTIDADWLARVKEVVDYVIDNGMYAIINIHHDGMDSSPSWLTPEPTDEEAMVQQFETIWKQIAEYFNSYGDHLLYAGMNEFHHGYNSPSDEYLRITNRLNQKFVDTVRASGGNNANRILIVQAYNTNGDAALKGLEIPTDSAQAKLMAEIHFYDPWNYAGEGKGSWGIGGPANDNWGQEAWVDELFGKLKVKFVDNGVPIILGEYGAVNNKNGYDDSRRYYVEYVTKAAKENGILPIWWDNGNDSSSGEAFALFNRNTYEKLHTDIHEAIMRAVSGEDYEIAAAVYADEDAA